MRGVVIGNEVYGLDLAQTDLVVLSACETQLGEEGLRTGQGVSAGDDIVGLAWAKPKPCVRLNWRRWPTIPIRTSGRPLCCRAMAVRLPRRPTGLASTSRPGWGRLIGGGLLVVLLVGGAVWWKSRRQPAG